MPGCCAGSFPDALQQRAQASGFGRLPNLPRLPKSKHVRLHCIISAKPLERHTWQATFGLGGSSTESASASSAETISAGPASGRHEMLSWQCCADLEIMSSTGVALAPQVNWTRQYKARSTPRAHLRLLCISWLCELFHKS